MLLRWCRRLFAVALLGLVVLPVGSTAWGSEWIELFDGTDLSRWQMSPSAQWVVEDGAIALADRTDGGLYNDDYLWTQDTYGDFVLELEFKVGEGYANSGVFLRTGDLADPVATGIEVQVTNSHGRPLSRGGSTGAIYDYLAPTKDAMKPPGEWNHFRITCRASRIGVVLNGQAVVDMDVEQWTEAGRNPDGTPNSFDRPLRDFAREGYIGLQDHGRPVWYRNIRIKPLDETDGEENSAIHEVPGGIPADLSEDVTDQLQRFIDSVPDNAVIRFPAGARYRSEGTLTIAGRRGLTVEGNGALFRSFDKVTEGGRLEIRNRAHWRVSRDSRDIILRDVHVRGPHDAGGVGDDAWDASREAQHAFDIDGASHVTLERVSGSYVFGDGAYLRSNHVVVRDSRFHNIGRQGLAVANARDVLIENNDVRDVRRGIFNIEQYAGGWFSDNVRILNNTTGRGRLLWMPVSGAGVAGSVLVAGNVMEASTGIPVIANRATAAGRRGPFVAVDNHFVVGGSPQPAFNLAGIDGLIVAGNSAVFPAERRMTAVRVHDSRGAIVTGNAFEGAGEDVEFDPGAEGFVGPHGERAAVDLVEIRGGYGVEIRTSRGRAIAVWRMGEADGVLSAFELQTDAQMAMVHLDADDQRILSHHVLGEGAATFRENPLPIR